MPKLKRKQWTGIITAVVAVVAAILAATGNEAAKQGVENNAALVESIALTVLDAVGAVATPAPVTPAPAIYEPLATAGPRLRWPEGG